MRGTAPQDAATTQDAPTDAHHEGAGGVVVDIDQAREARAERQARREHLLLELEAARARRRRRIRTV